MRKEFKRNKKQKNNQSSDKKDRHRLFLDEQYIKMAEEMERELFADGDSDAYESTDEEEARSYQRLINSLKADGIYQEDDAESDIGKKVVPMHRKIRFGKVAGVAILCCACIFAASMTSEANRNYFVKGIRYLAGDDTRVVVGNDDENEDINMDEYKAIADIENQLGIDMPEFYYRPVGFEFISYEVNSVLKIAHLQYQLEGNIVAFYINKVNENTISNTSSILGEEVQTSIAVEGGEQVVIKKIQEKDDTIPTYIAQWGSNDVVYNISGKIKLDELKKMLKQMKF